MNRTQEIGRVVTVIAAAQGHSQRDIARITGLDAATISRRIHKGVGSWTAEDLEALATHYDVPVSAFMRKPEDVWGLVTARYLSAA